MGHKRKRFHVVKINLAQWFESLQNPFHFYRFPSTIVDLKVNFHVLEREVL